MRGRIFLFLLIAQVAIALACGPVGPGELKSRFSELRPRLDLLAKALRDSARSGGATRVARIGWWRRCEVSSRTGTTRGEAVQQAELERLCPLVEGLAVNAFADTDDSVWLMTWSVGGPGDYGGYVLPGTEEAKRDFMVKLAGRFRFEALADSGGWMAYENL